MNKTLKLLSGLALTASLFSVFSTTAHAATEYYSTDVPIISDYETSLIAHSGDSFCQNDVRTIQTNSNLICWAEFSDGSNATNKVPYSTTGKKSMTYNSTSTNKVRLNISTATNQWSKVNTTGYFYS